LQWDPVIATWRKEGRGMTNRMRSQAIAVGFFVAIAGAARGSDVYVVRFDTLRDAAFVEPPCTYLAWRDELIFHNASGTEQVVGLLGVSNGPPIANTQSLSIGAGTTKSSEGGDASAAGTWAPDPQPLLWVAHLDVPDDVLITSRALVPTYESSPCGGVGTVGNSHIYAGPSLPVVRSLVQAGSSQVHLATDIGGQYSGAADDGRINVGIYNGGSVLASAVIEVRLACDGVTLHRRSITIPANTIVQVGGFSALSETCTGLNAAAFESYVVVTVDQPSFSYAMTLSDQRPPFVPVSSSP
jgi:hypothetical protein